MKLKIIITTLSILICLSILGLSSYIRRGIGIVQDLPELTNSDIAVAAISGDYKDLLVQFGVSGPYHYEGYIFWDGHAIMREYVFTKQKKEHVAELRKEGGFYVAPQATPDYKAQYEKAFEAYAKMIEDAPMGDYYGNYEYSLKDNEIRNILSFFGGQDIYDLHSGNILHASGLTYYVKIYIGSKFAYFTGEMYSGYDDVNPELNHFLMERIIQKIKNEGSSIDYGEYKKQEIEGLGKYPFVYTWDRDNPDHLLSGDSGKIK